LRTAYTEARANQRAPGRPATSRSRDTVDAWTAACTGEPPGPASRRRSAATVRSLCQREPRSTRRRTIRVRARRLPRSPANSPAATSRRLGPATTARASGHGFS